MGRIWMADDAHRRDREIYHLGESRANGAVDGPIQVD